MREGEKLGRFELKRRIGRGAVGAVFLAHDGLLDTDVCLKLLHNSLAANPEILARFSREVLLARRVTHPNVCRIFDIHEEGDVRFVTMEFIEGDTLANVLYAEGPMENARAVRIAERLCRALAVAHKDGIVHRDLKPGNIILRDQEDPVVLDFGIATALDVSRLTRPGVPLGTTHYIAPEVWSGQQATPRSDLYAVGVILYNMLTARVPFKPRDPLSLLEEIQKGLTALPSTINPAVPGALDDLVRRCMAFDPNDRPADADSLADELDLYLQLSPLSGPTDPGMTADAVTRVVASPAVHIRAGGAATSMTAEADEDIGPTQVSFQPTDEDDKTQPPRAAATSDDDGNGSFDDASFFIGGAAQSRLGDEGDDDLIVTAVDLPAAAPDVSTISIDRTPGRSRRPVAIAIVIAVVLLFGWGGYRLMSDDRPSLVAETDPTVVDPIEDSPAVETAPDPKPPVLEPPVLEPPVVEPPPPVVEPPPPVVEPPRVVEKRPTHRTRRAPRRDDRAFKAARDGLRSVEKKRGLRRGDDAELDGLVTRMNTASRERHFATARDLAERAAARAGKVAIDRSFVDQKLRRFNRQFSKVKDDERRRRVGDLLAVVVGHVASSRFDRANSILNRAFVELRS